MKKYTVGFIFSDDFKNVLLIKKTKPADQAGLFNGIGGKFEEFDIDAAACVSREVKEETGLDIPPDFWAEVGSYSDNEYYYVSILTSIVPVSTLSDAKSLTEEEVSIISMDKLDDVPFANMAREMLEHCRKVYI